MYNEIIIFLIKKWKEIPSKSHKFIWKCGSVAVIICNLVKKVVTYLPHTQPAVSSRPKPRHLLNRRVNGLHSRFGRIQEEKYLLTLPGIVSANLSLQARSRVTTRNELSDLPLLFFFFEWRHPDVLRFNIKMIKRLASNTSYFIVCEATCFRPYVTMWWSHKDRNV